MRAIVVEKSRFDQAFELFLKKTSAKDIQERLDQKVGVGMSAASDISRTVRFLVCDLKATLEGP